MEAKEKERQWWWWKNGDESERLIIMGSLRGFYRGFYVFPVILVKASLFSIEQDHRVRRCEKGLGRISGSVDFLREQIPETWNIGCIVTCATHFSSGQQA